MISFIHPRTCGFAKVALWEISKAVIASSKRSENETPSRHKQRMAHEQFQRFNRKFAGFDFQIDLSTFQKKLPDLRKKFYKWNPRKAEERMQYTTTFSMERWEQLSQERKSEHSLTNC